MLSLGLSAAEQREFHAALRSHHTVMPTVQVLNLEHKVISDVSAHLVSGEVNVLSDGEATRSASVDLFDPSGVLALESSDPSDGAVFLDNMIRIILSYTWPGHDGWVDVPVFTGPVTSVNRDTYTLSVEAQGKETLALGAAWEPHSYGVDYATALIRKILRQAGETRFDLPDLRVLTTTGPTVNRTSKPWKVAREIAESVDRQLFYDARGVVRLRRLPRNVAWTFRDGDAGTVTAQPRVSYDIAEVRNLVWVRGKKPKGSSERVDGHAKLPRANRFSPEKLGRNGQWGVRLEVIDNDHLKTARECHVMAVDRVNERRLQAYTIEAESTPIPHLEPGDLASLDASGIQKDFRLRAFTIPIDGSDSMSVGYTRKMKRGRKANPNPLHINFDPRPTVHRGGTGA